MKQILNSIQNKLSEIPELRYSGEDWGQLDIDNPAVKFPCALVDMDQFNFSQAGQGVQIGEGTVQVTIADIRLQGNRPPSQMDRPSDHDNFMTLVELINSKLHGYYTDEFQPLQRISAVKLKRPDGIRSFTITYETAYFDRTAQTQFTPRPINNIDINT
ncbi:hypothetical protein MY04_4786 [Flammeovirga sp. MY04]|uniref:hypothetical protein n=1 Tax=Flammeovirga sp. MY04 TaxID=1191459 RepID=UPI0008063699|nr:hypothetical protein [Flammeovirga sp. MY04]ANQ49603.1 hypothetical protein MY04_2229 [Flammeovirga sp. MY04]ANQ52121.1 hypothetical protein MY04_4786 [Flammeovirga sp. MY04]